MSDFDDRFADRVREVFDAYEEPVDPAALARMRAALGPAVPRAPDRAAADRRRPVRRGLWVALAAALAVWLGVSQTAPGGPDVAAVPTSPHGVPPSADPAGPVGAAAAGDAGGPDRGASPAPPAATDAQVASASRPSPGRATSSQSDVPAQTASGAPPGGARAEGPARPSRLTGAPPVAATADLAPGPVPMAEGPAGTDLAARPAAPAVLAAVGVPEAVGAALAPGPDLAPRPAVRVVVSTATVFTDGRVAEGAVVSAGLALDRPVGRGVSVSGGAVAAFTRFAAGPSAGSLDSAEPVPPGGTRDVTERQTSSTVAIEVPLDVAVDVVSGRRGRVGVSVGVTSALYLSQTFRDEGRTLSADAASVPFDDRESVGALGRLDLARQLNLSVRLAARSGLGADVYARLPLAGLTSRDLDLTTVGLRLRVPLR